VVLALCPEPERLLRAAERAGVGAFAVELARAAPQPSHLSQHLDE
jgi:hypothetical protein